MRRFLLGVIACAAVSACEAPALTKDGQLVFQEKGAHGAAVMTANGVEFRDVENRPRPVIFTDPDEPWHSPIGFIVPASGRFTETSQPVTLASPGVAVVLRSSDVRVPSWGGEILVRVDVHAVGAPDRDPESFAIVVDGPPDDAAQVAEWTIGRLGAVDHVMVVDAIGARTLVPLVPATHRSLALATLAARLAEPSSAPRDVSGALRAAKSAGAKRVILVTSPTTPPSAAITSELAAGGVSILPVALEDPTSISALTTYVPPIGKVAFKDLYVSFDATPSPSHVLESSSGDTTWTLEGGEVPFGSLRAGEARSEIVRVTVPAWVPGPVFTLHVDVHATDANGVVRDLPGELTATYDDDVERIAESRAGDVIAYASALATMHRLEAAFVSSSKMSYAGVVSLAKVQAQSLAALAHDFPDRGFAEDARVLDALLSGAP